MKRKDKKNRERKTLLCKIWSVILAAALVLSFLPSVIFAESSLPFTDVSPSAWYFKDVKNAYEKGLINGKSATRYAPDDQMTYAEAVKLAACMYQQKKEGSITLKSGNPWYTPYVEYAYANGLISELMPWDQAATRAGYMSIFANVLSDADASKNAIADGSIPDVPANHPNAAAIYKLYRAGIVTGVDAQHNCKPLANIKRSEVAATLTRMTDASARVAFNMGEGAVPTPTSALAITKVEADIGKNLGDPVTIKVYTSGGKGTLKYQWRYKVKGVPLDYKNYEGAGATTDTMTAKVEDHSMVYCCVVTDEEGQTSASDNVVVEASNPLKITKEEENIGKNIGDPAVLKVEATGGTGTLKYQWQQAPEGSSDFTNSTDPGNDTDTLQAKVEDKTYQYRCVVTDEDGAEVTSKSFMIKGDSPLKIIKEEANIGKKPGDPVTIKIIATGGTGTLKYQWFFARRVPQGLTHFGEDPETTNTLTTEIREPRVYYCVVTDEAGTQVTSNTFSVHAR